MTAISDLSILRLGRSDRLQQILHFRQRPARARGAHAPWRALEDTVAYTNEIVEYVRGL